MANDFEKNFTISNLDKLKFQYKKGAAFYHLKAINFGPNPRNTQLVCLDDTGASTNVGRGRYEHLSFGNGSADEAFSVAWWMNLQAGDSAYLIDKVSETDGGEWQIYYTSSGKLKWELHDESADATIRVVSPTIDSSVRYKWAHIVCTYDASEAQTGLKVYVNAVSQSTSVTSANGTYVAMEKLADVPVVIGGTLSDPDSENFVGYMTDIAFFNKELSSTEVEELYNLYFNTHYKDLDVLNVDYNGKQMGSFAGHQTLNSTSTNPGDVGLIYKTPLYNHSAASYICAGWSPNAVTGSSTSTNWAVQFDNQSPAGADDALDFHGRGPMIQRIHNLAATGSSGNNILSASWKTTYEPSIVATCERYMFETGSNFPSDRVADLNAKPTFGLNVPGPHRLRLRKEPYKVTKK